MNNIGLIGHVSHGKTTIIKALSGISTLRHSSEKQKKSTIYLGYANALINNKEISFIDCPGHEAYIHNMLNGTQLMDCAFLIVDATDKIVLQSQAVEHLIILMAIGIRKIIVIQNKIDLLEIKEVKNNCKKILEVLENNFDIKPMVYPVSAQFSLGTDEILNFISELPEKESNENCIAIIPIIRSFDINKPKTNIDLLKGGVIGGGCISGKIKKNTQILIIPGIIKNNIATPFITNVNKIQSENTEIEETQGANLVGIETDIDPYYTKDNGMVGQFVYYGNRENITIYKTIVCKIRNLKRVSKNVLKETSNVKIHCINNIYNAKNVNYKEKKLTLELEKPIFISKEWKISIFILIDDKWKFSFIGEIIEGNNIELDVDNYNFPKNEEIEKKKISEDETAFDKQKYKKMLEKCFENKLSKKEVFLMKLPKIKINNNKTFWLNLKEITEHICSKTKNENLENIIKKEIRNILGDYIEKDYYIVFEGKLNIDNFTNFLKMFRIKYLECNACKSHNTYISKKWIICLHCSNKTFIS